MRNSLGQLVYNMHTFTCHECQHHIACEGCMIIEGIKIICNYAGKFTGSISTFYIHIGPDNKRKIEAKINSFYISPDNKRITEMWIGSFIHISPDNKRIIEVPISSFYIDPDN